LPQLGKPITVCLVGSSHARYMHQTLSTFPWDQSNITISYFDSKIPRQVEHNSLTSCNAVVISVGQWPAARHFAITPDSPYTFARMYAEYKAMTQRVQREYPHVHVLLRSINYNPLGNQISACPPKDWRNPLVIDGYNSVIRRVVRDINHENNNNNNNNNNTQTKNAVQFVDTNSIIGPVWDAAGDWCHPDHWVRIPHSVYVLVRALEAVSAVAGSGDLS